MTQLPENDGLPVEQFIQALTSQLDRVQATMALKAKTGIPLTFAVKDLSLDLRAHVEMVDSVIRLRPAAPGERDSSVLHINLTTITAPMIEENARSFISSSDPPLREALGSTISEEEQRRLEWIGVRSVSQLRTLHDETGEAVIGGMAGIPVNRLRLALQRADGPTIHQVEPFPDPDPNLDRGTLHIRGDNLVGDESPLVQIDGRRLPVLQAEPDRLVVAAPPSPLRGLLHLQTGPGMVATHDLTDRLGLATEAEVTPA